MYFVFTVLISKPTCLLPSLYDIYIFAQYIKIVSIDQELMCPIQYQNFEIFRPS